MDPKFKVWLIAAGFDPEALEENQVKFLEAKWKAETEDDGAGDQGTAPVVNAGQQSTATADTQPSAAEMIAAERQRVANIEAACGGSWEGDAAAEVETIRRTAIANGDSVEQVNAKLVKILRASRPQGTVPAFIGSGQEMSGSLLEAALCLANRTFVKMDDAALVAAFGESTMEAAHKLSRVRLTEIMAVCAEMDGVSLPRVGRGSNEWIRAAFSSISLPGILSNVANKALLAAYNSVPSAARQVARIGQVSDFKAHTRYRLTGNMIFEKVLPGGELPHGELGEQSFSVQADTYGKYFALTRTDIVNDDLGAFLEIPRLIGRGSAISIEEIFFTLLLANSGSFFGSGNSNIYADAAAALSDTALDYLANLFMSQTDPHGKPINVMPAIMLVPTAKMGLAERLYKGQNLFATGLASTSARTVEPDVNVHAGKYRPVTSPYLSNTNFHASASAVDWYLFADPQDLAAFEIAFLNGVETPTVESVGVAPNTLGMGFRGYHDVGVAALDPRAACKADVG